VRVLFLPDYSTANAYQRALIAGLRDLGVEVRADRTRRRRVLPVSEAILRHGRPDVIHVHWTEPYIAGGGRVSRIKAERTLLELRLAKRTGTRIVWTVHDLFRHDRSADPLERAFMRSLVELCATVIVRMYWKQSSRQRPITLVVSSRKVNGRSTAVGIVPVKVPFPTRQTSPPLHSTTWSPSTSNPMMNHVLVPKTASTSVTAYVPPR